LLGSGSDLVFNRFMHTVTRNLVGVFLCVWCAASLTRHYQQHFSEINTCRLPISTCQLASRISLVNTCQPCQHLSTLVDTCQRVNTCRKALVPALVNVCRHFVALSTRVSNANTCQPLSRRLSTCHHLSAASGSSRALIRTRSTFDR
jgi:hypothetical protein